MSTAVATVPTVATAVDATVAAAAAKKESSSSRVKVSHINVSCERTHLSVIQLLGCVLSQLVSFEEQSYPTGRGGISMFHTAYVPSISIGSYLKRVSLYTKVSTEVLIQSVLHVHQLMQRTVNPLVVNKLNVHRLLLTSLMCTAKYFDDAHYNNAYYSYVGGVPLKELNALEVEFLSLLNFDFYVNPQTYQYFYSMVVEKNIHLNGCTCGTLLAALPKSMPVNDYTPCPEPDFSDCPSLDFIDSDEDSIMMDCRSPTSSVTSTASSIDSNTTPVMNVAAQVAPVTIVVMANSNAAAMDDMNEELGSIKIEEQLNCASTPEASAAAPLAAAATKTPRAKIQVQVHQYQRPAASAAFVSSSPSSRSSYTSMSRLNDSPVSSIGSVSSLSRASSTSVSSSYVSRRHQHSPSVSSISRADSSYHHASHNRYSTASAVEHVIPADMKSTPKQQHLSVTPRQSDLQRKEREVAQMQQQRIVM